VNREAAVKSGAFTAVVLAGERPGVSPVAAAAGVCCKALAEVAGRPMVLRVLDALGRSESVGEKILCGLSPQATAALPELAAASEKGIVQLREGRDSPSGSTAYALRAVDPARPVLLTTADHALLESEMVDYFCQQAQRTGADLVVALASARQVMSAFPGVRRTVTRLRDDGYCGCNLFAFLTPESRVMADVWQQVEQQRKRPWRVIAILGWSSVLRYLIGQLSLQQALDRLSLRLGIRIAAVTMPFSRAAVDVDTPEDWELVKRLAADP
jgi:GTP:adenosylcobinamide-phosphate guanylyltransferase